MVWQKVYSVIKNNQKQTDKQNQLKAKRVFSVRCSCWLESDRSWGKLKKCWFCVEMDVKHTSVYSVTVDACFADNGPFLGYKPSATEPFCWISYNKVKPHIPSVSVSLVTIPLLHSDTEPFCWISYNKVKPLIPSVSVSLVTVPLFYSQSHSVGSCMTRSPPPPPLPPQSLCLFPWLQLPCCTHGSILLDHV